MLASSKLCRPRAAAIAMKSRAAIGVARRLSSFISHVGSGMSPLETFRAAIAAGTIREDPFQMAALEHLDRVHHELVGYTPPPPIPPPAASKKEWRGPKFDKYGTPIGGGTFYTGVANQKQESEGSLWASVASFFGGGPRADAKKRKVNELPRLDGVPRGVYMYGGVGVGKSLLMDTFFDCAPVPAERKRRVHFHEFMLEVHRRMHKLRQSQPELGDPLPSIAYDISSSTTLLCFDEFQVTDVADALVMRRLFNLLFSNGLVMVATSNRPPADLYKNGIQRESFLPFIAELQERCHCHDLASKSDYRMMAQVNRGARIYMHPLDDATQQEMDTLFTTLLAGTPAKPQTIRLGARDLEVPLAGVKKKVARFTFAGLCGRPLGAEDYLRLAATFHTVMVEKVPQLTMSDINQVRRMITMVDAFYDNSVKLIISAAVPPEELFKPDGPSGVGLNPAGDLLGTAAYVPDTRDEVFAFERTLSRLNEMRTHAYLIRAAAGGHSLAGNAVPLTIFAQGSLVSEKEARQLFSSYDVDASGMLEYEEVELMLQDLSERLSGHRNLMCQQVEHALAMLDADKNGEVSEQEFVDYFTGRPLSSIEIFGAEQTDAPEIERRATRRVSRAAEAAH